MKYISACFLPLLLVACTSKTDIEKEKKTILGMLQTERKAHFDRNVDLFM